MCKLTKSRIGDRNGTYFAIMLPFLWHMAYSFMAYVSKKAGSESKVVGKKAEQIEKLNMTQQHTFCKNTNNTTHFTVSKGQLISEANFKFLFEPKTELKYFCNSALHL